MAAPQTFSHSYRHIAKSQNTVFLVAAGKSPAAEVKPPEGDEVVASLLVPTNCTIPSPKEVMNPCQKGKKSKPPVSSIIVRKNLLTRMRQPAWPKLNKTSTKSEKDAKSHQDTSQEQESSHP